MAVLPTAYAASLLRHDAGRSVFFPDPGDKSYYVIPDIETEQRIFHQLERIRAAQLAAWVLLPVIFIAVLIGTDGDMGPKWLVLAGCVIVGLAIQFLPEWSRHRLARGLILHAAPDPAPSLLDKLPAWAIVLLIALVFGLAIYYERIGALKAFLWFDDIAHFFAASKVVAIVGGIIGAVAAALWGGVGALRRWFRS